jgi:hypothetical protein
MSLVLCTYSTSFLVQVKVEIIDEAVEFGAGSTASVLKNLHWIGSITPSSRLELEESDDPWNWNLEVDRSGPKRSKRRRT